MLSAIVAIDNNNAIGKDNELIYSYKKDMDRFIDKTMNKTVIMGYNTWKSLKVPFLKDRTNIVVVRDRESMPLDLKKSIIENSQFLNWISEGSLIEAIPRMKASDEEYIIMGGAYIYDKTFHSIDKLYLTIFDKESDGDRFFPSIKWSDWNFEYSYQPKDGVLFLDMVKI